MTAQPTLFDAVTPYAGHAPHAAMSETSREAADAIEGKLGRWQARVLRCLYVNGPLSDEGLEILLDCVRTRTSRPRRRELELAGYVEDSGARGLGLKRGTSVVKWRLTEKGRNRAKGIEAQA